MVILRSGRPALRSSAPFPPTSSVAPEIASRWAGGQVGEKKLWKGESSKNRRSLSPSVSLFSAAAPEKPALLQPLPHPMEERKILRRGHGLEIDPQVASARFTEYQMLLQPLPFKVGHPARQVWTDQSAPSAAKGRGGHARQLRAPVRSQRLEGQRLDLDHQIAPAKPASRQMRLGQSSLPFR